MQFNDSTNNLGIIQACERYTRLGDTAISGSADRLKEFTAYSNTILRRLWHDIFMSSGQWQYDDGNNTDLPQATNDLENGTAMLPLPSAALTVKRVEIKDSNGNWVELVPVTLEEIPEAVEEWHKEDNTPHYYRLLDDTIELFPAPNYDSVGGFKIYFDRGSVAFASDDTTQAPGFASEYHDLVPVGASLEYLMINFPGEGGTKYLQDRYIAGRQELMQFYNRRFKDKKIVLTRRHSNFK